MGVLIRSYIGICGSVRVDHESPEVLREEERRWEFQVLHGSLEYFFAILGDMLGSTGMAMVTVGRCA